MGEIIKIVHIGGVSGVGKSTVLRYLERLAPQEVCIISASSILNQISTARFGSEFKNLEDKKKVEVRIDAVKKIQNFGCAVVILDSHYVDKSNGKFVPIIPLEFANVIDLHIVIEAEYEQVLERRLRDTDRLRSLKLGDIKIEAEAEKDEAFRIARSNSKDLYLINNSEPHETAKELINLLRKDKLGDT